MGGVVDVPGPWGTESGTSAAMLACMEACCACCCPCALPPSCPTPNLSYSALMSTLSRSCDAYKVVRLVGLVLMRSAA